MFLDGWRGGERQWRRMATKQQGRVPLAGVVAHGTGEEIGDERRAPRQRICQGQQQQFKVADGVVAQALAAEGERQAIDAGAADILVGDGQHRHADQVGMGPIMLCRGRC